MASAYDVVVRFLGDTKDLKREVDSVGGAMTGLAKTAASVFAGSVFVKGAKDAIDAASNLQESLSKSNAIFGKNATAIEAWAKDASKSFGQSEQQALESASSFGNMFQQLGLGLKPATAMSKQMVELASDFASFHNADITDVLAAQQAAFRGEYDAVQKFVPTINAAAVAQQAMAETGKTSADQLTEGEKAAAAYTLMVEGAGKATGDFARTADGAANQQRILAAEWENAKAKLGSALLPVFEQLLPVVVAVVDAFSALPAELQAVLVIAVGAGATLGPLVSGIADLASVAATSVSSGGGLGKMAGFIGAAGPWVIAAGFAAAAVVGITTALKDQGAQIDINMTKMAELSNRQLVDLINQMRNTSGAFKDANFLNQAFNQVLGESPVQAQRWIEAAKQAGLDTERWTEKLHNHQRDLKQTANDTEFATGKVNAYSDSLNRIPDSIKTQIFADIFGGVTQSLGAGGVVDGPRGSPQLVLAHGGETVLPTHRRALMGSFTGGGSVGPTFNIQIDVAAGVHPAEVGAATVDAIRAYERVNGRAWRNS